MSAVLDLYPAEVVTPQGHFRKARVRLEDGHARIFVAPRGYVELAAEGDYSGYEASRAPRTRAHRVSFADGSTWEIKRAGGCGCGSPLRRFNPRTWG